MVTRGLTARLQVVEGEGYDAPKDASKVTLKVTAATDGAAALPGFEPTVLEFTARNGDACDVFEGAAGEMRKGEHAVVTCTAPAKCIEAQLGLEEIAASQVALSLESGALGGLPASARSPRGSALCSL